MHITDGLRATDVLWYGQRANAVGRRVYRPTAGIGDGTFARWWDRSLDQAGVRYRNPHMTRHTFATRWLQAGGRLEKLSMAMGHASIKTTFDLYGHLDFGDVAADLALIEASA
jgi:integrase